MLDRTDPEMHLIWLARYSEACRQFTAREISVDVYSATLYGLGFRNGAIQAEINLNFPSSPGRPY